MQEERRTHAALPVELGEIRLALLRVVGEIDDPSEKVRTVMRVSERRRKAAGR